MIVPRFPFLPTKYCPRPCLPWGLVTLFLLKWNRKTNAKYFDKCP